MDQLQQIRDILHNHIIKYLNKTEDLKTSRDASWNMLEMKVWQQQFWHVFTGHIFRTCRLQGVTSMRRATKSPAVCTMTINLRIGGNPNEVSLGIEVVLGTFSIGCL